MGVLYEHWRPDLNECFYVGISWGQEETRPYNFHKRNPYHQNVVAKLKEKGLDVEVRIQAWDLTKEELCELEVMQIAYWRELIGDRLTNLSSGGEGGIAGDMNPMKNPEVSKKISGKNHYVNKNPEKLKELINRMLGDNNLAKKPEVRKKISDKQKGIAKPYFLGDNNPAKKPGVGNKIKLAFALKNDEEKAEIVARANATKMAKSNEEKALIEKRRSESIKTALSKRTKEQKEEQIKKTLKTLELKGEDAKLKKLQKFRETISKRTNEEKTKIINKIRATIAAKSDEEKLEKLTRIKLKHDQKTPEQKAEIERKRQESRRRNKELKLAAQQAAKDMEN